ncbi:two-component system sensor histidine kinase [Enterococcus sp. 10A9_DIV0425]|uniref:Two-component system sensor histidine kinase n=1 Tax=Candidatus Enterococcus wittei TaxID=1987383 RepID=A0A242JV96_9ENTE|nr:sensor histidine kinase [Enterococcus sp. 10A9_DIV0425]OTP06825.1 two-component system sensor histidine kinase [Enterococcus sp. 10A9_DIV0425]THE14306.1 sensor histidine kinase [Enterococcus hirae]
MNRWRFLFSKGTLLNRLLRKYAIVTILLTMVATVIISIHTFVQKQAQAQQVTNEAVQNTLRTFSDKQTLSKVIKNQVVGNSDKIENITTYLTKPIDEYLMYAYDQQQKLSDFLTFPNLIRDIYVNYEEVRTVYVVVNQLPEYFASSREDKGGKVRKGTPQLKEAFYIKMPITQGGAEVGSMFIGFDKNELDMALANVNSFDGLSLYMISGTMNRLYTFHDRRLPQSKVRTQEKKITNALQADSTLPITELAKTNIVQSQVLADDYRILAALDKHAIRQVTIKNLAPLIIGVIFLDGLLLFFLYKTFKRYSQQIDRVMEAMDEVAKGNLDTRVDTSITEYELKDLSNGINHMLGSINQFVEDIYKLEIKQQDAHMRALQAQINPHFLYNTLEYIRMYALSEGSEELADVVYAFSALLRNNTNQDKTICLKEELDFCEKYVYLYQMRYPNRVAYHFTIETSLEQIEVPKFVIQPLVENYFKHGIDFTRYDNALSVKVFEENEKVQILIRDNGKGITDERLAEIRARLTHQKVELFESIGIQNVNERMRASFGQSYQMIFEQNREGGLTIRLMFKEKRGESV